jgi:hypothetical protein
VWPIYIACLLFIVYRIFLPSPFVIFHFSHNQPNWFSASFPSTTLQNLPGNSDLLSEVSKFQHHTKLYSKCNTSPVYSSNISPICWWIKKIFLFNAAFAAEILHLVSRVTYIICYHVNQPVEIFHVLRLCLVYSRQQWRWYYYYYYYYYFWLKYRFSLS